MRPPPFSCSVLFLVAALVSVVMVVPHTGAMPLRPVDDQGRPVDAKVLTKAMAFENLLPGINGPYVGAGKGPPLTGTANVPVILIKFPSQTTSQTPTTFFNMLFPIQTYPSGSMNDYFREVSYANLSLWGQVVGWYTAANFRSYYVNSSGGMANTYPRNSQGLVREAVLAADAAGLDFSNFDNDGPDNLPNSGDDDGFVDCVIVVFAGYAAEYTSSPRTEIWSHMSWQGAGRGPGPLTVDGVKVDLYTIQSELRNNWGSAIRDVGVFCHEFGHALGLPDLYSTCPSGLQTTYGSWNSLGEYCLMSFGGWGGGGANPDRPLHLSGFGKAFLGWANATRVTVDLLGVSIPEIETNNTLYTSFPFWPHAGTDTNPAPGTVPPPMNMYPPPVEGWIVENRQQVGFDAGLPGSGLLIYHMDGIVANQDYDSDQISNMWDNAVQWSERRPLLDVECADQSGLDHQLNSDHLDAQTNFGDATDFYYLGNNTTFDAFSTPSNLTYAGTPSTFEVRNVGVSGPIMTADLIIGVPGGSNHDIWVKDCPQDDGSVPSTPNCDYPMYRAAQMSPDIWVDNDWDGVIDAPVHGAPNRLFVRVRNQGPQPVDYATVTVYDLSQWLAPPIPIPPVPSNPFWSNAQIASIQAQSLSPGTSKTMQIWWNVPPAVGFQWPPSVGLCVQTSNDAPGPSGDVAMENNLAITSGKWLYCNAGLLPKPEWRVSANGSRTHETTQDPPATPVVTFIPLNNPFEEERPITLDLEADLLPGWTLNIYSLEYGPVMLPWTVIMPPLHETALELSIEPAPGALHGESGSLVLLEYMAEFYPLTEGLIGSLVLPVQVDVRPPLAPTDLLIRVVERERCIPALQNVELSWDRVEFDISGLTEEVAYYSVFRDTIPNFGPDPDKLIGKCTTDGNEETGEWEWYDISWPLGPTDPVPYYRIVAVDKAGNESESTDSAAPTDVNEWTNGRQLLLRANVPNPFSALTSFNFFLPHSGHAFLAMYDARGRLVATLIDEVLPAGMHWVRWDLQGRDGGAAAGVYFARLQLEDLMTTRKVVLER